MDQYIMNKYYNHYMEKIILIFSFVLICCTKQETLKIKSSYLSYLPDIKDNYSIAAQMLTAQKQQQREKTKASSNVKPVVAPNPVINNKQVSVQPPASKTQTKPANIDSGKKVQQKQNSQPTNKESKPEFAFETISKNIQFAQSNYSPKLKEPRTYQLNKIDESSVLDAQGNIASKSPNSQMPATTTNSAQTNLRTKVEVQQHKIVTTPIESPVEEKIQQKPQPNSQDQKQVGQIDLQRKPIKTPTKSNKIQSQDTHKQDEQQTNKQAGNFRQKKEQNSEKNQVKNNKVQNINENFMYSRALFVVLFGLSALVIIFGYTPEKKERRYVPQEMDQQQSSLR